MRESLSSLDLASLAEASDLECKAAQGRDRRGELPEDFWKSYSAMANADGELIMPGVQEKPRGQFAALGLVDIERVAGLVRDGLLATHGAGRGMLYLLPWQSPTASSMIFDPGIGPALSPDAALPPELGALPPELGALPPELGALPPELGALPPELGPIPTAVANAYLDWTQLPSELRADLNEKAKPVSARERVAPAFLQQTVLKVCQGHYLGLRVLAYVLRRNPDDLRKRTLIPMVKAGSLKTAFAAMNDPRQAYTTVAHDYDNKNESTP